MCSGGGGILVTVSEAGTLHGVEAVIDKDLAGEPMAWSLEADYLLARPSSRGGSGLGLSRR